MRFLMLMYPGPQAEAGFAPHAEKIATMMKFNGELADAGALIALDGLHPTAKGARVRFQDGKAIATDGPFTETKEVLGGYWMIQVASKEEAVELAKRVPADDGQMIELRQVYELSDFPEDAKKMFRPELHPGTEVGASA